MRALLQKLKLAFLWFIGIILFIAVIAALSAEGENQTRRTLRQASEGIGYILDTRTNVCYAAYAPKPDNDKEIRFLTVPCTPEVLKIAQRR